MLHFCCLDNIAAMAVRYLHVDMKHLPIFQSGSTCGGIHSEERKGRKVCFYLRQQLLRKINLDPIFSESRFGTIAHKNKKRITAGTQYLCKPPHRTYAYPHLPDMTCSVLYNLSQHNVIKRCLRSMSFLTGFHPVWYSILRYCCEKYFSSV